ncbi:Probable zinc-ribbon domain-containing protein [Andreprevotia lacus DSM 23236]|jgi:hypothetical protein|uniref:Probable zinc-ribbon domain-containing protein n=1 Tax=Andreprevotia lacus DSM 23236 TaxID=1121001 RepID=A0A1W1Y0L4_9NEIS|nr:zinc-ribbon domain containing protein [Andreprevotia lacus]SMC29672.1 Probable zinc-ribbon domain-containing protein [Andreprevotia lacus DSM 23236]
MLSGKQKRAAIMARRKEKREGFQSVIATVQPRAVRPAGRAPVDVWALAPSGSVGEPEFVRRGYYEDIAFTCRDCGARQVWTAEQQQWWYETAKGYVYSTAVRCLGCRQQRRRALGGQ